MDETDEGQRTTDEVQHIPVLVEEVMSLLRCEPGQTYIDATVGGGSHASEILRRTAPDGIVIGLDWDDEAISESRRRLEPFGERAKVFRENFIYLAELLEEINVEQVDGILFDLGVSSFQLEKGERGFAFQREGPLDMRMDQRINLTATDLVNHLSAKELEEMLFQCGEERWAKRIVSAIIRERDQYPIETTQSLRKIVHHAIPRRFHSRRIDPATKTFQALRIHVNDELENLRKILESGWKFLRRGGRMCIISFHSIEDRMTKQTLRQLERGWSGREGKGTIMRVLTKKPITPSQEERSKNPRSRSAKLRCAERV